MPLIRGPAGGSLHNKRSSRFVTAFQAQVRLRPLCPT